MLVSLFLAGSAGFIWLLLVGGPHSILEWGLAGISTAFTAGSSLSLSLSLVLLTVSTVIFFFSHAYLGSESGPFLKLLLTFIISMLILVHASSFPSVMLGWDGLGLTSFFLILYYRPSHYSERCGMITLLTNRLGDCLLFVSLPLWVKSGYSAINLESSIGFAIILILASMTKSAQWPFSAWLPAAMAAPTPVSALVHSSTLVVAGAFLLTLIDLDQGSVFISFAGTVSYALGALLSAFETDLKKLIAYSTLSHMGLLFVAIGCGCYGLAMMHLIVHALFKSSLFMLAGYRMMEVAGVQDTRSMGSPPTFLVSAILILISANLLVVPFVGASLSKHPILLSSVFGGAFFYFILVVGTLAGGVYTARVWKSASGVSARTCILQSGFQATPLVIPMLVLLGWISFPLDVFLHPWVPGSLDLFLSLLSISSFLGCLLTSAWVSPKTLGYTEGFSWSVPSSSGKLVSTKLSGSEGFWLDPSWWSFPRSGKWDPWHQKRY